MTPEQLEKLAKIYGVHQGYELSTISTYAINDGSFFKRLTNGASPTYRTVSFFSRWLSNNWPDSLDWPADIPRPEPASNKKEVA